jgi:hypothetical protein
MMQLAAMMKMQTRSVRLTKMRTMSPKDDEDDDNDNLKKSTLFDDNDDGSVDNAKYCVPSVRGLVQAASQRVVVRISPTLMVCLNKRQRRRWVSGRRTGREREIEIEGRVRVRRLTIPYLTLVVCLNCFEP